jgi:hypothetical protein
MTEIFILFSPFIPHSLGKFRRAIFKAFVILDVFFLHKEAECLQLCLAVEGKKDKGLIADKNVLSLSLVIQEHFFLLFHPGEWLGIQGRGRSCILRGLEFPRS